jgi:hypothetical protein
MDVELDRRWRIGDVPFDGTTLSTADSDPLPLAEAHAVVLTIVRFLRQQWPDAGLFMLHDWHRHDGYLTTAIPISWDDMDVRLRSVDSFRKLSTGDTFVSVGIFPSEYQFYLRFDPNADEDLSFNDEQCGDFDLTCSDALAGELKQLIGNVCDRPMILSAAKGYFDRMYAG